MSLTQQLTWLLDTTQSEKDYIESGQKAVFLKIQSLPPIRKPSRLASSASISRIRIAVNAKKRSSSALTARRRCGMFNLVKSRDRKADLTNENSPLSAVCAVKEQGGLSDLCGR